MNEEARTKFEIETRVAREEFDDHRYRGYSLFHDLLGVESLSGIVGLAVAGRRFTVDEVDMLNEGTAVIDEILGIR